MKTYSNYTVRFAHMPKVGIFVRASSPERAVEEAIRYENLSLARLYSGRPEVTPDDLVAIEMGGFR